MKKQNKVAFAHVQALIASLSFKFERVGETAVTGCWAFLPNGFQVGYGESACVDPNEYKQADGEKYAKERCVVNATNKLWELEGYLLKVTGSTSDNHTCGNVELTPKDRLVIEIRDLREKLGKLVEFKEKEKPDFVCHNSWDLMGEQIKVMKHYIEILEVRLNLFK